MPCHQRLDYLGPGSAATKNDHSSAARARVAGLVSRRCRAARGVFPCSTCCHMFPAAGITTNCRVAITGKTLVRSSEGARKLLDSIEGNTLIGLCDCAPIRRMVYSRQVLAAFAPSRGYSSGTRVKRDQVAGCMLLLRGLSRLVLLPEFLPVCTFAIPL